MNNIVLLYSDVSKGMKSYGPKAIVPMGSRKIPLIIKQIESIKKLYKDVTYQIYVVLGFDQEKIRDLLKKHNKYQDIIIIQHKEYVKENQGSGFIQAIDQIKNGNLLVVQNGIFANYIPTNLNRSTIPVLKNSTHGIFPVGVRSNNGVAEYLFYGLEYDWPEICYFAARDYDSIRDLLINNVSVQQKEGMFLFEHINYLIDHNYSFYTEVLSHKHIKKVINHKEIC